MLITVEGIDQSGKRTQSELLTQRLRSQGINSVRISFPNYKTPVGQLIKKILANEIQEPIEVKHLLLSANRWELKSRIEELMQQRYIIIFDRYYPSNWAYGVASNLPLDWLKKLDDGLPLSDLTIVIDVPPTVSFKRKEQDRDLHERDFEYLSKVRKCFIELACKNGWIIIDGDQAIEEVHNSIWKIVSKSLKHNIP
ncbi:MAG: dTMP kinase [Nitrososphaeria archaeon]